MHILIGLWIWILSIRGVTGELNPFQYSQTWINEEVNVSFPEKSSLNLTIDQELFRGITVASSRNAVKNFSVLFVILAQNALNIQTRNFLKAKGFRQYRESSRNDFQNSGIEFYKLLFKDAHRIHYQYGLGIIKSEIPILFWATAGQTILRTELFDFFYKEGMMTLRYLNDLLKREVNSENKISG